MIIIKNVEEIKRRILMYILPGRVDGITAGTVWAEGRVSYTDAELAIIELEKEGRLIRYTEGLVEPVWKKNC
ncbi:hypothetical protein ACFLY1_00995 [Patescibacteria group bacterium]